MAKRAASRRDPASDGAERITATRAQVLRFRFAQHGLEAEPGSLTSASDVALLDHGVQDTGTGGSSWALAVRGAPPAQPGELALAWTLRGAPHGYRRGDLELVAVATAPYSEADAAKRIFDASAPLRAAGIAVLDALRTVATEERRIVRRPTGKGELSSRLADVLDEPYLRWCRPCQATHAYEQPFRLAALQAGLVLDPGTSPPVLRRVAGLRAPLFAHLAGEAEPRHDVVRGYLRDHGPATPNHAAAFVDATVADVKAHWPDDVVEVSVRDSGTAGDGGRASHLLVADRLALEAAAEPSRGPIVRLLGPYDPFVQLRDRELLVPDGVRRRDLWRTLGRPGAVVVDGHVVGTWRQRTRGSKLTLTVQRWVRWTSAVSAGVADQAERFAAHRDLTLAGVDRL